MSEERISVDNPIQSLGEDKLNRAGAARFFADYLLKLDTSSGVVVGLFGSWGSGKTSFINMAKTQFKENKATVIDFNPWMFGGTNKLLEKFFAELSAELKIHNVDDVAKSLLQLGSLFLGSGLVNIDVRRLFSLFVASAFFVILLCGVLSIIGFFTLNILHESHASSFQFKLIITMTLIIFGVYVFMELIEDMKKGFKKIIDEVNPPRSVHKYQKIIEKELKIRYEKSQRPLIVVLDDIDRLKRSEVKDIFRMIRLTTGFPHLIYIVMCDRSRIEQALRTRRRSGQDYLEKFIQISYDLPIIANNRLEIMLLDTLREIDPKLVYYSYQDRQVIYKIISPLIKNMRNLRRYKNAIWSAYFNLHEQVNLLDVFVLEAIHMFAPALFDNIKINASKLTVNYNSDDYMRRRDHGSYDEMEERRVTYSGILNKGLNEKNLNRIEPVVIEQAVKTLIEYIFPYKHFLLGNRPDVCYNYAEWEVDTFRNNRIAHQAILYLYLEGGYSQEYEDAEIARKMLEYMERENWSELNDHVQSIPVHRWTNVIKCLRYYDQEISELHPSKINNSIVVLWNLLGKKLGDHYCQMYVNIITNIFLYRLRDEGAVVRCITDVMGRIESSFCQVHFLELAAHRKAEYINRHPRISEEVRKSLSNSLSRIIFTKDSETVSEEYGLDQFLVFILYHYIPSKPSESVYNHIRSPKITMACVFLYDQKEGGHFERLTKNDLEALKIKMHDLEEALADPIARHELEMWFSRQYGGSARSFNDVDNIFKRVKQEMLSKSETL